MLDKTKKQTEQKNKEIETQQEFKKEINKVIKRYFKALPMKYWTLKKFGIFLIKASNELLEEKGKVKEQVPGTNIYVPKAFLKD